MAKREMGLGGERRGEVLQLFERGFILVGVVKEEDRGRAPGLADEARGHTFLRGEHEVGGPVSPFQKTRSRLGDTVLPL